MPEDSITYAISVAPRPAPSTDSASAPRLASLSTSTRTPRRSLSQDPTSTSTQPGRIVDELTCPVARSIGPTAPRRRRPAARARHPRRPAGESTSSAAVLEAGLGVVVDVRLPCALGEDRERQVRDRDAHEIVVELDADHGAGSGIQRQHQRRPAARGGARGLHVLALDHQSGSLELADERRDRRAREARRRRDLRTADGAALAHDFEHLESVQLAQRAKRSNASAGRRATPLDPPQIHDWRRSSIRNVLSRLD